MTGTAIVGIAFVALGVAAALLMLHLWGYPFDEKTQTSSAPKSLELLHRALGYAYAITYVIIMVRMVPRLWLWPEELPARSIAHAVLGVAIGAVLLTKILVIRFFPYFRRYLHVFGISLLVLTLTALALPLAFAVREWHLARANGSASARTAAEARLATVPDIAAEAARLASADGLAAGREAFLRDCMQCHDTRAALQAPRTAAEWLRTTARMAEKSAASPDYRAIRREDAVAIAAYLTNIRGRDAAPAKAAAPPASAPAPSTPPTRDGPAAAPAPDPAPASAVSPVDAGAIDALLAENCAMCHSGARARSGIVLESAEAALASGAVTPGDVRGSRLLRAVRGEFEPRMPLNGPYLSPEQIALLEAWVASMGAPAAAPAAASGTTLPAAPAPRTAPRPSPAPRPMPGPGEQVRFDHVQPIFNGACVHCHSRPGSMGAPPEGFVIASHEEIFRSPERPVVIPGHPGASLLMRHIMGTEPPRMPLDGPPYLTAEETALVERWIRDGARDAQGRPGPVPVGEEVRLRGTLQSHWVVDGVAFRIGPGTEVRDAAVGRMVEMRGRIAADGSIVAERVRGR
jgi:mono/diheme cytochrome c family protein